MIIFYCAFVINERNEKGKMVNNQLYSLVITDFNYLLIEKTNYCFCIQNNCKWLEEGNFALLRRVAKFVLSKNCDDQKGLFSKMGAAIVQWIRLCLPSYNAFIFYSQICAVLVM